MNQYCFVKYIKLIVIVGVLSFLSCGKCGLSPDVWTEEIEDDVKASIAANAYLAKNFFITEQEEEDLMNQVEGLAAKIEEDASVFETCLKYKSALELLAPTNEHAAQILYKYNSTLVKFSNFYEEPMDGDYYVWSATELITGIKFKFKINRSADLEIEYDIDSFERYIESLYN